MRLKYQLFLTLLAASAVLILAMLLISNWNFSRGFLSYVNQAAIERMEPFSVRLEAAYVRNGENWNWLNEKTFSDVLGRTFRRDGRGNQQQDGNNQRNKNNAKSDSTNNKRQDRQPKPSRTLGFKMPRLVVADENRDLVFGRLPVNSDVQWQDLSHNEQVIGYLGIPRITRIDRQFDLAFANQQKMTLLWTALAMIALSALLSIPLAARLVRPLLDVNTAVQDISGGNYSHRVGMKRKDEIGELARNIDHLGRTLESNQQARQRWIAEISHELRTPLAVLRAELEAVQDGVRKPDEASIDSLHNEVLQLNRLVDDLHTLSMSDVGSLNYKMEPIDLRDLVHGHIASIQPQFTENDIALSFICEHETASAHGDRQRLEQLLANLAQNSLRYTKEGGKAVVKLDRQRSTTSSADAWVLEWSDSTPGPSDETLSRLFEPLYRAEESRNRQTGGAGLGLAICKRIVEAHDGTIDAHHSDLGGLEIVIRLPIA